jgi:hypothetical protein
MAEFGEREKAVIAALSGLVGQQLQVLYFLQTKTQQREKALQYALTRRGLLTAADWSRALKEVEAGAAVDQALAEPEAMPELRDMVAQIASMFSAEEALLLEPVVESAKEIFRIE